MMDFPQHQLTFSLLLSEYTDNTNWCIEM